MTNREERLVRGRTRLAVAYTVVQAASNDVIPCDERLGLLAEQSARRLLWLMRRVGRELDREVRKARKS
jgi:hypothetical protein